MRWTIVAKLSEPAMLLSLSDDMPYIMCSDAHESVAHAKQCGTHEGRKEIGHETPQQARLEVYALVRNATERSTKKIWNASTLEH